MDSNRVCGVNMSKGDAHFYLDLFYSVLHKINFALIAHESHGLSSQDQTAWSIIACRNPNREAYSISAAKKAIASDLVAIVEEGKGMKYGEYACVRPKSLYPGSLWSDYFWSVDDGPINNLRNWFSHNLGHRTTTLEKENESFASLVEVYKRLQPVVEELVAKLEAALEDESAWGPTEAVNERRLKGNQPDYTKDCEAVQRQMKIEEEGRQLRWEQRENEERINQAREEAENEDPWRSSEWVQTGDIDEGAEWLQTSQRRSWLKISKRCIKALKKTWLRVL